MQRRFVSLAFVAALIAMCPAACSGMGEGQRCSIADDPGGPDNSPGSSDCANNLKCYKATELPGAAGIYGNAAAASQTEPNLGICCPLDRKQSTTAICSEQTTVGNVSPPDSGAGDAASADGASQADGGDASPATDAPASTDAPADAPATTDAPADVAAG